MKLPVKFQTVLLLLACWGTVCTAIMRMETKEIVNGVRMPVMSIGCGGLEHRDAHRIVSNWLMLGGTGIDTALNYGNQDQVRKAIAQSGIDRENLFITTKIPDCNATNVAENIRSDLELLGTSYVDLMLIHSPRRGDCLASWRILEEFFQDGKIRAIGVSNFHPSDLEPLAREGSIVPHVNQIQLNLLEFDPDTVQYCTDHGIAVEAYSPLGRGGTDVVDHPVVRKIAQSHNVTAYQIALKWILQHGWVLTFQSSSPKHQATDSDVFGFELTPSEMLELDQIGPGWTSLPWIPSPELSYWKGVRWSIVGLLPLMTFLGFLKRWISFPDTRTRTGYLSVAQTPEST